MGIYVPVFLFQTSDWTVQNSVMLHDTIIMSGFPHTLSGDELKTKLPEKHQKGIEKVCVPSLVTLT